MTFLIVNHQINYRLHYNELKRLYYQAIRVFEYDRNKFEHLEDEIQHLIDKIQDIREKVLLERTQLTKRNSNRKKTRRKKT